MGFPLTPRSMTLDDLELLYGQIHLEFRDISRVSEAITAKRRYRRVLSTTECTFQRCIGYVDIAGRSPAMGRQTSADGENTLFSSKIRQYHSSDGADGCCITSNKSLTCLQLVFTSNWSNFGMLSHRVGLSASAGLSCYPRDDMLPRVYESDVSVRPSVCYAPTRRYCVKKKKASVMISSASGSPTILVF